MLFSIHSKLSTINFYQSHHFLFLPVEYSIVFIANTKNIIIANIVLLLFKFIKSVCRWQLLRRQEQTQD